MASAIEYAQWIVSNQDKRGTAEFNTVVQAYEIAKQLETPAPPPIAPPPPSPTQQLIGAGEAALTTGTAALLGPVGALVGGARGVAQNILEGRFQTPDAQRLVEEAAARGAQAVTYQPRTEAGKRTSWRDCRGRGSRKDTAICSYCRPSGNVKTSYKSSKRSHGGCGSACCASR
ncbi:MAG: hypothetical protein EBQ89_00055 [Alphaproteobacteria bacterium]|nr:hypothetical protein [Alphaproteobacteria bacterium]